ncbi:hypothetical protein FOL46_000086, partial [Perkinsus olseni]
MVSDTLYYSPSETSKPEGENDPRNGEEEKPTSELPLACFLKDTSAGLLGDHPQGSTPPLCLLPTIRVEDVNAHLLSEVADPSSSPGPFCSEGIPASEATTVMLRDIERELSQEGILRTILEPAGVLVGRHINFFYAPINFRTLKNAGYCFINFVSANMAQDFRTLFDAGTKYSTMWARIQGIDGNVNHYKKSPVIFMADAFTPKLYAADGSEVSVLSYCGGASSSSEADPMEVHDPIVKRSSSETITAGLPDLCGDTVPAQLLSLLLAAAERQVHSESAIGSEDSLQGRTQVAGKIFVGGLDPMTTEADLVRYFSKYGGLSSCVIKRDSHN